MALPLTSFNQQSCIRKHSEVITISPFSRGPRSPHLMLPSWELQGSDPSPLLPVGVGPPDWGLAPGPYLTLWPFLVGWSVPSMSPVSAQPSRESEHQSRTELGIPSGGVPLHSSPGSSAPIQPSHQSTWLKGQAWLESHWGLQKCCRNQCSRIQAARSESWRTQVYYTGGPEELPLQALSLKQRDCRVFIDRL